MYRQYALSVSTSARLLAGLVEWYGSCARLRAAANLVVVGGIIDPSATKDHEEREQCQMMHDMMEKWAAAGLLGCCACTSYFC